MLKSKKSVKQRLRTIYVGAGKRFNREYQRAKRDSKRIVNMKLIEWTLKITKNFGKR